MLQRKSIHTKHTVNIPLFPVQLLPGTKFHPHIHQKVYRLDTTSRISNLEHVTVQFCFNFCSPPSTYQI